MNSPMSICSERESGSFRARPAKSRKRVRWWPGWSLLATLCLLLGLAQPTPAGAGDLSPEFTLMLNDMMRQFPGMYVDALGVGSSRICPLLAHYHATNAVSQRAIKTGMMSGVVGPLNEGIKFAASASGVGTVTIFAYDVAYCAYTSETKADFGECLVNAVLGAGDNHVGGKVGKHYDDDLKGALVSLGSGQVRKQLEQELGDRYFGEWSERVKDYQAVSEQYTTAYDDGRCINSIEATWDRRKNLKPGYLGGMIRLRVDPRCDCNKKGGGPKLGNRGRLEKGLVLAEAPVRYVDAGTGTPGWRIGKVEKVKLEGKCCGLPRTYRMAINSQGQRVPWDDPPSPANPEPNPPTSTGNAPGSGGQGSTPTPPKPNWSVNNPCPRCQPIAAGLAAARHDLILAEAKERGLKPILAAVEAKVTALANKIATLEARLQGEQGIGATLFDADGTKLKSSIDQGNGTVRIVTYTPDGSIQSVEERQRRSTKGIQEQLTQARKDLADAEARQRDLRQQLSAVRQMIQLLQARLQQLHQALVDCIAKHCNAPTAAGGHATGSSGTNAASGGNGVPSNDDSHNDGGGPGREPEKDQFGGLLSPGGSLASRQPDVGQGGEDSAVREAVEVHDLNSDGVLDVLIANRLSGLVSFYVGDGVGFTEEQVVGRLTGADRLEVADLNFDGLPDVVVASPAVAEFTTLINDGNGAFEQQAPTLVDLIPQAISVEDLNVDRVPDVRVDGLSGEGAESFQGDGVGGFQPCDCDDGPGTRDESGQLQLGGPLAPPSLGATTVPGF